MNEKKAMFIIFALKNIINVYFDTFFVFYFFKVANYNVLPLAKYYVTLYLFIGIGFFLIRNAMKKNVKVPYFRIGIALEAVYISLIMLLKEKIINYIFLVGITKGIADGFYNFPKNILSTEKVDNESRQKFDGWLNTINKISSIIIPLCLGVLLTFIDYTNLGKIFFILFIMMFILSFWIQDEHEFDKRFELRKFAKILKKNKAIKRAMIIPLVSGLTYSNGVMVVIVTLFKINNFKTNLNLGFVDSLCAVLSLIICILYSIKIKKTSFKKIMDISGIVSLIILILFALHPNIITLIIYLVYSNSIVKIMELITNNTIDNLSNCKEIKKEFKPEYYCFRDIIFSISRSLGYLILLFVCFALGMEYIHYILLIPALALFLECFFISKLNANN